MGRYTFKSGQFVTVFKDPLAERHPEGEAELIEPIKSMKRTELWLVRFRDEQQFENRKIRKDGYNTYERAGTD